VGTVTNHTTIAVSYLPDARLVVDWLAHTIEGQTIWSLFIG